jgi:CRP-like cAMP-binding protein
MVQRSRQPYYGGNFLLDTLPETEIRTIELCLDVVHLDTGDELYHGFGERTFSHVYFPMTSVVSMMLSMSSGETMEADAVGREGLVGYQASLGQSRTLERWVCNVPGEAARMSIADFRRLFAGNPRFASTVLRYCQAVTSGLAQSVACNRFHSVTERCAKWLLLAKHRANRNNFSITHEFVAGMLGVRRAGVTLAESGFERSGFIVQRRGMIQILNHAGLQSASCECYSNIIVEYDRIMSGKYTN